MWRSGVGIRDRGPIEQMCREVLYWVDTKDAARATTQDFEKALVRLKECMAECIRATERRLQEAPLTLHIYQGDELLMTGAGKQLEGAIKNGDVAELKRLLALQHGRNVQPTPSPPGPRSARSPGAGRSPARGRARRGGGSIQ